MHPILFDFGSFSVKTYGFLIAIGFLLGITLALKEAKRQNYDPQIILDLSFYMIVGAIVGSRIFYIFTHLSYFKDNILDAFKLWQGGLTFFGGFIMAMALSLIMIYKHKLSIWKTLDIFAPSLALGVFFGRMGCFAAGCCHGKPCDLPWAITFTNPESLAPLSVALHPTQLYSSLGALLTFVILFLWRKRKTFDGQLALMWIFLYSGIRSVNEFFRGDSRGDLLFDMYPTSRVIAWCLVAFAVIMFPILKKKYNSQKQ